MEYGWTYQNLKAIGLVNLLGQQVVHNQAIYLSSWQGTQGLLGASFEFPS